MFDGTRAHVHNFVVSLLSRSAGEAALARVRLLPAFQLLLALVFGVMAAPLVSQEPPVKTFEPVSPSKTPSKPSDQASNDPLRILWLKNPVTGELVPVAGLTIDEYDKLDRIQRGLPPEMALPPNYVLGELNLAARIEGGHSECELNLEVELRDDAWARIPLNLNKAMLRAAPGEAEWFVAPDTASDGYVLWAKGRAGEKKTLTLPFSMPTIAGASSTRLQLPLPRARTARSKVTIAPGEFVAKLEGSGAIDATRQSNNSTEVDCSGFSSLLDLSWSPKSTAGSESPWMEAVGDVDIHVDGRRQVRIDAKYRIRTFGSLAQPLRIRLPERMRLSPNAGPISPLVRSQSLASSPPQPNPAQQVLELTFDAALPTDFEIRVQAESDGPIAAEAAKLSLGQIEILDAKRHSGVVDLFLTSDWFVASEQPAGIRRIDVENDGTTDANFLRSRFEYSAQPTAIQISARLPRTLVEPGYDLFLEANQARLEGVLKYRFRGPSTGRVEIDLGDWEFDRLQSPDAAFLIEDAEQQDNRLMVPLAPQQSTASGDSTLRIYLRRPLSGAAVQMGLPRPAASVDAAAIVRVFSDTNLEISPRLSDLKGVSIDTSLPDSAPQLRGQFAFRTRPSVDKAVLAFDVEVRKQSILLDTTTQLELSTSNSISVEHSLRMNIAYEPLRELRLELPIPAAAITSTRVLLDDLVLNCNDMVENDSESTDGLIWTTCRYDLPQSYLGALNLTIQYPFAVPQLKGAQTLTVPLPKFVTTSAVQAKPHQLVVRDSARRVQVDTADWSPNLFEIAASSNLDDRYFSLEQRAMVRIILRESRPDFVGQNRCDRMWLQTTLGRTARHDRLCIRMTSWSTPLLVQLPENVKPSTVVVAINGEAEALEELNQRESKLTISASPSKSGAGRVVEIWYQCDLSKWNWGGLSLDAPSVLDIQPQERSFWHLIVPPDWYSLVTPPGWTMERGNPVDFPLWQSRSESDQLELEKWTGASTQTAPSSKHNQYLYGATDFQSELALMLAPRRAVWFTGLGIVFCVGTLLVYVRWARRPFSILILLFAAAAMLIFQPNWGPAVVQFVILGGVMAMLVGVLRMLLSPEKAVFAGSTPSRSSAPKLAATEAPHDSQTALRRGSSVRSASVATGPAP